MRGNDEQQLDAFSYVCPEQRVPHDHPLRPLRVMTDEAFRELQPRFRKLYAKTGRPSIAPEKLLRALLDGDTSLGNKVKHRSARRTNIFETFGFSGSPEGRAAIEIAVRS